MILLMRKIWLLPFLLLMLLVSGCSSHDEPAPWEGELSLVLRVGVVEPGRFPTRAVDSFQAAELSTEKLHSVRVIIVKDADNLIVHNDCRQLSGTQNQISGLRYKVDFSTKYRIYLIANEAGITGSEADTDISTILTSTLRPGATYPENILEHLVLSASDVGDWLIDNMNEEERPIPMSEMYDITTVERPNNSSLETIKIEMEEKLFVTRAASKFSFRFLKSQDYRGDNNLEIKCVRITGLGWKEYLLPCDTEYTPTKGTPVANNGGREITAFTLPVDNSVGEYTFELPTPVDVLTLPQDGSTYSPRLYFPESKGNEGAYKFMCSISYDGINYLPPVTLPNLPSLPRNTHAIVNITIGNDGALFYEVKVEPWTPEYLEIDFTDHVAIADDGTLTFVVDTYASLDKDTGRLVLNDYPKATSCSFGISEPLNARWDAYLVTTSGELNAIQFQVTDSGGKTTFTDHLTGIIDGKKVEFKVAATQSAGNVARSAMLQIMVTMTDGLSVPVNILKSTDYGQGIENITFIQNPQ